MLKFFLKTARHPKCAATDMAADLLDHPDIARMDARELGDLPFPRSMASDMAAECACPAGSPVQAKASVTLTSPTNRPFQLCMA